MYYKLTANLLLKKLPIPISFVHMIATPQITTIIRSFFRSSDLRIYIKAMNNLIRENKSVNPIFLNPYQRRWISQIITDDFSPIVTMQKG